VVVKEGYIPMGKAACDHMQRLRSWEVRCIACGKQKLPRAVSRPENYVCALCRLGAWDPDDYRRAAAGIQVVARRTSTLVIRQPRSASLT